MFERSDQKNACHIITTTAAAGAVVDYGKRHPDCPLASAAAPNFKRPESGSEYPAVAPTVWAALVVFRLFLPLVRHTPLLLTLGAFSVRLGDSVLENRFC